MRLGDLLFLLLAIAALVLVAHHIITYDPLHCQLEPMTQTGYLICKTQCPECDCLFQCSDE